MRPIAFYGSEKMGVSTRGRGARLDRRLALGRLPRRGRPQAGIRVKTSSFSRHHVNVSMCRAKYAGTYANSILANMEATDLTATTKHCCSTSMASSRKVPARTCSS
jgi:branched-chain amino acid aminotransferase